MYSKIWVHFLFFKFFEKKTIFIYVEINMNKKFLKSIISIATGISVSTLIPFATTSCGCSSEGNKSLPNSGYDIDETTNVLKGFKEGIDLSKYDGICNTIQIPARVTSIGNEAFLNNSKTTIPSFITKLTFAARSNCNSIGYISFAYNSSLTSITLPKNLRSIGEFAFAACQELTSVKFPSSLESIGKHAFAMCLKLTSVNLSNRTNLSGVGEFAFNDCPSLSSIDLSNCTNLSGIGNGAFINCSALTSIDLSKGTNLRIIKVNAFGGCPNLSSIIWNTWTGSFDFLASDAFNGVCQTGGTVKVTNPTGGHDSAALLAHLKQNGGLPNTWQVAED